MEFARDFSVYRCDCMALALHQRRDYMRQFVGIAAFVVTTSLGAGLALAASMPSDIQGLKALPKPSIQHVDWHRHHHCWWKHGHKHCN
jgi:hypothetical protein